MGEKENDKDRIKRILELLSKLRNKKSIDAEESMKKLLDISPQKNFSDLISELKNMGFDEKEDGTWSNGDVEVSFYEMDEELGGYENEYFDFIGSLENKKPINKKQQLEEELEEAVLNEDYERAIKIRDELKNIV